MLAQGVLVSNPSGPTTFSRKGTSIVLSWRRIPAVQDSGRPPQPGIPVPWHEWRWAILSPANRNTLPSGPLRRSEDCGVWRRINHKWRRRAQSPTLDECFLPNPSSEKTLALSTRIDCSFVDQSDQLWIPVGASVTRITRREERHRPDLLCSLRREFRFGRRRNYRR